MQTQHLRVFYSVTPKCDSLLCRALLKEELTEQKNPYEVQPTENYTRGDSYEDAYNKSQQTALLVPGRPSYSNFYKPVNYGDEQKY